MSVSIIPNLPVKWVSFWSRQFDSNPTTAQNLFDVVVGVLLPIFCLCLYPSVARSFLGDAGSYPCAAIAAMGLSMVSLVAWLLGRGASAFVVGVMLSSAILALAIGMIMLPLSLLGMLFTVIAILGFSPFITAFAFARNTVRAWRVARTRTSRSKTVGATLVASLVYAGLASGMHWYITTQSDRAITMLTSEDPETSQAGVRILKRFSWVTDFKRIVRIYEQENDPERRQRLANSYRELADEEIDRRLDRSND